MNRAFSAGGLVSFTTPGALPQANVEGCAFGAKRKRRLATPRFKSKCCCVRILKARIHKL